MSVNKLQFKIVLTQNNTASASVEEYDVLRTTENLNNPPQAHQKCPKNQPQAPSENLTSKSVPAGVLMGCKPDNGSPYSLELSSGNT